MNKKNKSLISILVAASLTGCFGSKTTDELISEAKVNTEQQNYEAAVVLLKNALRNESESAIARFNLGLVYFNLGQMELAEKELNLALKYGYDNALVTSYLIKVFNAQDKDAEVIDIYEASNGLEQGITGEIAFYSALAFRRTNEVASFNEAIGILKQIGINTVYADLSDALLNIAEGDYTAAITYLNSAKTKDSKIILLDLLLGEVYTVNNQTDLAIKSYKAYLTKASYNKKVQLMIANLLIKDRDYLGAEVYLDELIQAFPKHSIVNQLKAIVKFEDKDYEAAIEFGEVALQADPSAVTTKLITGLSAYYLKRFELAHQYLNAIRNELPKTHPAKKVLAIVQNQLGYKEAAIDTMSSFDSFSGQDIELLSEIGKSVVNAKDIKNITGLIDKISKTSEKSATDLINMGRLKLSVNDVDGLIDIEKALKLAPEMNLAKEALIQAYIVQYEFTKALALSKELQQSQPKSHKGYEFSAKAMLGLGNLKEAIKDAQKAVELKNNDTSSVVLLANLHLLNENKVKAKETLLKHLAVKATDIESLMFYYKIEKELGNEAIAIKYIQDIANKFETDINVSLLLGTIFYMEKDFSNVINTLKYVDESKANSNTYWFVLGSSYFYTRQFVEARDSFLTWYKNKPGSKLAALKLATAHEALKEFTAAKEVVDSELEKAGNDVQLQMLQAYYAIRLGKYDDANYLVKKLERNHPDSIQVAGLKGQLYYGLEKYTESLPLLNKLYTVDPNQQNISILASSYAKAGLASKAVEVLNRHQEKQSNIVIESLIAQYLMAVDYNKAKPKYAELVKKQPNNVLLLNNYAWTLFQLKEYELAKSIIEKAVSLMPMQPKLLDTLGVILLAKGEKQQAISTFQRAVELAPKDSEIALHLDEALRK